MTAVAAAGCSARGTAETRQSTEPSARVALSPTEPPAIDRPSIRAQVRKDIEEAIESGDSPLMVLETLIKPRLQQDPELAIDVIAATRVLSDRAFKSNENLSVKVIHAVWVMQVHDLALAESRRTQLSDPGNGLWRAVRAERADRLRDTERMLDQLLEGASYYYLMGCSSVFERVLQETAREGLGQGDAKRLSQSILETARGIKTPADLDAAVEKFAPGWRPSDYGLPDWTVVLGPIVGVPIAGKLASGAVDLSFWREQALVHSQLSLELVPWANSDQKQLHRHLVAKSGEWYGKDYDGRKEDAKSKIDAERGGIRR
jgi:hypothetical protein